MQTMPDILQTYLLFVVLPVVLGFTFNVVALYMILNADLIWQRVAGARRTHQPREDSTQPTVRPRPNAGGRAIESVARWPGKALGIKSGPVICFAAMAVRRDSQENCDVHPLPKA